MSAQVPTGLLSLLRSLQTAVDQAERSTFLSSIFTDESVVTTVFRLLPEIEKNLILKIVLLDRPITDQLFSFWAAAKSTFDTSIVNLTSIGVIVKHEPSSFDLHPDFRASLVASIARAAKSDDMHTAPASCIWDQSPVERSIFGGYKKNISAPSVGETKWHSLLDRMISSAPTSSSERDIDKVIQRLGFGTVPTPPYAFKFVLADTSAQLWTLISEFVTVVERGTLSVVADVIKVICGVISYIEIFALSSKNPFSLSLKSTSSVVVRCVLFLEDLDVIRRNGADGYSLGTVAAALNPISAAGDTPAGEQLLVGAKLIVDSNMHVTAYTRSNLQVKLISLFCQVQRIMGSVLVGSLTRSSVQKAIDQGGVSADSIIRFLSSNLHPVCAGKIPPNVSNQIRLWEQDCPRNRLKLEPCVCFSWRGDRSDQATTAMRTVKQLAEAHKGLLFVKPEPDGRVAIGVREDVARKYILQDNGSFSNS